MLLVLRGSGLGSVVLIRGVRQGFVRSLFAVHLPPMHLFVWLTDQRSAANGATAPSSCDASADAVCRLQRFVSQTQYTMSVVPGGVCAAALNWGGNGYGLNDPSMR